MLEKKKKKGRCEVKQIAGNSIISVVYWLPLVETVAEVLSCRHSQLYSPSSSLVALLTVRIRWAPLVLTENRPPGLMSRPLCFQATSPEAWFSSHTRLSVPSSSTVAAFRGTTNFKADSEMKIKPNETHADISRQTTSLLGARSV